MKVLHKKTNEFHEAVIELVKDEDWEIIEKSGSFVFNWRKEKDYIVHEIRLQLEDKILGLISVEAIPKEYRLHIHLIESSNLELVGNLSFGLKKRLFSPDFFKFIGNSYGYYQ